MKIRVKGDNVLIRKDGLPLDERGRILTEGGISIRPDAVWSGEVLAVGPGRWIRSASGKYYRNPPNAQPGTRVCCEHLKATEIDIGGIRHMIIRDKFVMAEEA